MEENGRLVAKSLQSPRPVSMVSGSAEEITGLRMVQTMEFGSPFAESKTREIQELLTTCICNHAIDAVVAFVTTAITVVIETTVLTRFLR
jgi:hypothetical protein